MKGQSILEAHLIRLLHASTLHAYPPQDLGQDKNQKVKFSKALPYTSGRMIESNLGLIIWLIRLKSNRIGHPVEPTEGV